jgi:pilus assembly protein Flp/PilA
MERQMKNLMLRFVKDESGVTAIEYGLIAALVSVAILAILTQLGGSLVQIFTTIANALATAAGGA